MSTKKLGLVVLLAFAGISWGARAQAPPDYERGCTSAGCHDSYGKLAFVHDPVASDSCDGCHELVDKQKHQFRLIADEKSLCLECHEAFEGKVLHEPAANGECTVCHDPHASATKHLISAATTAGSCAECHEEITEERKFLHGPVAAGACTVCHNPHASEHSSLLPDGNRAVCVACHEALATRMAAQTHQHAPVTEECIACHDPHGAGNRMNLKTTPPGLCLDCHDSIADVVDEAAVTHDAVTAKRSCVGCHEPHASDVELLLLHEPMDLCLSCHDKQLESGDGKIMDMADLLAKNPNHHGPIRQKNCTACHPGVHGGAYFRLLLAEFPPEFYAPFEERRYAFCFSCHEADVVRDERTDKLTNFRNGDYNLHHLHVNRKVKGRTCRACHNTHASQRPKHITETVPFGSWQIPINFEKSPTGGSCLPGCHRLYKYDRNELAKNLDPEQ